MTKNEDSLIEIVHEATGAPRAVVRATLAFAVVGLVATPLLLSWGVTAFLLSQPINLRPLGKQSQQREAAVASSNDRPEKGTLPWAIDMIERLDRSLGESHARLASQRVKILELEKKVDWLEQVKATK